jgi:dihydroxyacetone kinase
MMKARYGTMAKQNTGTALQKEKVRQEQRDIIISNLAKEYSGAAISEKELENIKKLAPKASDNVMTMQAKRNALKMLQKKSHGGSMKKGYGKARSSGMGLEDESLVPGKGYEYIKDLL